MLQFGKLFQADFQVANSRAKEVVRKFWKLDIYECSRVSSRAKHFIEFRNSRYLDLQVLVVKFLEVEVHSSPFLSLPQSLVIIGREAAAKIRILQCHVRVF